MVTPLIAMPGGWELIVIVLVLVLLFGARKLPELARGTGQALRIFKSETKGLTDDSDEKRDQLPQSEDSHDTDASTSETNPSQSNPSKPDGTGR